MFSIKDPHLCLVKEFVYLADGDSSAEEIRGNTYKRVPLTEVEVEIDDAGQITLSPQDVVFTDVNESWDTPCGYGLATNDSPILIAGEFKTKPTESDMGDTITVAIPDGTWYI